MPLCSRPTGVRSDIQVSSEVCLSDFFLAKYKIASTQSTEKDAAAIRANHSMPAACGVYYFEVEVIEKGTQV
jgi:hypothetical protein